MLLRLKRASEAANARGKPAKRALDCLCLALPPLTPFRSSLPLSTMTSLPAGNNEAGMRALDAKCEDRHAHASTRTVVQLSKLPLAVKKAYMNNSCVLDLPHLVRCLIEAELSADARVGTEFNEPALLIAARNGSARALKALLSGGANNALTDERFFTPLHEAAFTGQIACLQLLLNAGAKTTAVEFLGNSPLMLTVAHDHVDCARALLPVSDLSLTNRTGRTALHLCATSASDECFLLLLPHYGDVDVRTVPGVNPDGSPVASGFNVTPLHSACAMGQHEMAKALLRRGASRMARNSLGWTPLHVAALEGHLRCVIVLVGRADNVKMTSAEVNVADAVGATPLHYAAQMGRDKICGLLLEAGARLDAEATSGHTSLMVAQECQPDNASLLALLSGQGPALLPGTNCDHCGKTPAQASVPYLKTCGECQSVRYCGAACSAAAWRGHKAACRARVAEVEAKTRGRIAPPPSPGR